MTTYLSHLGVVDAPAKIKLLRRDRPALRRVSTPAEEANPSARALSVRALLHTIARERGGEAGYIDVTSGDRVAWSDIERQAGDWADQLPAGTAVGLRTRSPAAFCRAYLAALASGVCVVPLDLRATDDELATVLDVLEIVDLVVDTETDAEEADSRLNVWVTSADGLRQGRQPGRRRAGTTQVAVLLPTSGTTGRAKIVGLTEGQLLRAAARIARHHELAPGDRGYSPLPLFHVNAQVVGVLSTLVVGGSLVVEDRFHPSEFWAAAEELAVTWLNLVPAILGLLGSEPPPGQEVTERVRFARSASAPLPRGVRAFRGDCRNRRARDLRHDRGSEPDRCEPLVRGRAAARFSREAGRSHGADRRRRRTRDRDRRGREP